MNISLDPLAQPATEFAGKIDFELGTKVDKVTGIIQDCTVTIDGYTESCSAKCFSQYKDAQRCIEALRKYEGEGNVAKGRFICRDRNEGGLGGVVLLEPLSSFQDWLNKKGKADMWESNVYTECIGLGPSFKNVFYQIGSTMSKLNNDKVPHKNLKEGIMFGSDGNIRICNFFLPADVDKYPRSGKILGVGAEKPQKRRTLKRPSSSTEESKENKKAKRSPEPMKRRLSKWSPSLVESEEKKNAEQERANEILQDIMDFISLIEKAATIDGSEYTCVSGDIDFLRSMFDFKDEWPVDTANHVNELGVWIYNSIICWNIAKVISFIFFMDALSYDNELSFCEGNFFDGYMRTKFFSDWKDKLRRSTHTELIAQYDGNGGDALYVHPFSVLRFGRNCIVHRKRDMTEEDACRAFLRFFPDLVGKAYTDFFLKMRNRTVKKSSKGPQKYHGKMFDTVFKMRPSIFNLDEPL